MVGEFSAGCLSLVKSFYSPIYAFYQIIISSSQVDFGRQEGPVMEEKSEHESGVFMPIKRLIQDIGM